MKAAYKMADGKKIEGKRITVDVERGRTVPNWYVYNQICRSDCICTCCSSCFQNVDLHTCTTEDLLSSHYHRSAYQGGSGCHVILAQSS